MPQADAAIGVRYAIGGDKPSLPQHTGNLVADLRGKVMPSFNSATERDVSIKANMFTPAGIPDGFPVYIKGSGAWEFEAGKVAGDAGGWVPRGPYTIATYTATANQTAGIAANNGVTFVSGINGGATFRLRRKRRVKVVAKAVISGDTNSIGTQYRLYVTDSVAGGEFIDHRDNLSVAGSPGADWFRAHSDSLDLDIGDHGLSCVFQIVPGSGGGIFTLSSLIIKVIVEGPA